jgi:hypothetical protein
MKTIITLLLTLACNASFAETVTCGHAFDSVSFNKDENGNITNVAVTVSYGASLPLKECISNTSNREKITTCTGELRTQTHQGRWEERITATITQKENEITVNKTIKYASNPNGKGTDENYKCN